MLGSRGRPGHTEPALRGGAGETVEGQGLHGDSTTPFEFNMRELAAAVESAPSHRTAKNTDWKWIALNLGGGLLLALLTLLFLLLLSR